MLVFKIALCFLAIAVSQAKPGLKLGGKACEPYPDYCQNGGTCYTQYTQAPVPVVTTTPTYVPSETTTVACQPPETQAPTTQAPTTTVSCEPPVYTTQPPETTTVACQPPETQAPTTQAPTTTVSCQPPVFTTQAPTQPPTTTQYQWITQPVCGCQPQFVGDRCEQPVTQTPVTQPATTMAPITYPAPVTQPECIPPTDAPVVSSPCDNVQCMNGGSCLEITIDPFVICTCPPGFTGPRCETIVTLSPTTQASTTLAPTTTVVTEETTTTTTTVAPAPTVDPYGNVIGGDTGAVTHIPHCNFTIKLLNEGAFTARMRLSYKIDGIQQPLYTSENLPIIGNTAEVTIPWYATDLVVSLERLGFNWAGIHQDVAINSFNWCNKCYKVWNVVTDPKWDYLDC